MIVLIVNRETDGYAEGLREFWDPIKAYWAKPTAENGDKLRGFLNLKATKWQFTHGTKRPDLISPDNYWHVQYLLDRPGNQDIQLELFLDYRTNVGEYAKWQALFRKHQPPTLLMWGKNDHIFPEQGAHPYKRDLKNIEFHILDTGHFALEEYGPKITDRILVTLAEPLRLDYRPRLHKLGGIFHVEAQGSAIDNAKGGVFYHLKADYLQ